MPGCQLSPTVLPIHLDVHPCRCFRAEIARKNMFVKEDTTLAAGAKRPRFVGGFTGNSSAPAPGGYGGPSATSTTISAATSAAMITPVAPQVSRDKPASYPALPNLARCLS